MATAVKKFLIHTLHLMQKLQEVPNHRIIKVEGVRVKAKAIILKYPG